MSSPMICLTYRQSNQQIHKLNLLALVVRRISLLTHWSVKVPDCSDIIPESQSVVKTHNAQEHKIRLTYLGKDAGRLPIHPKIPGIA
jgi:hypothetical protein